MMRRTPLALLLLSSGCLGGPAELRVLWSGVGTPARVGVVAQVVDGDDQGISDLEGAEFTAAVDGEPVEDFVLYGAEDLHLRTPLTLLIDQSQGVLTAEGAADLRALAGAILDDLPADQPARVLAFSDGIEELQDYTTDRAALQEAVDALGTARGAITDLRGALIASFDDSAQVDMAMGLVWGLTVVITDGGDGPVVLTDEDVREARGDRALLAIDVEGGQAGPVANLGAHRVRKVEDLGDSGDELRESIRTALLSPSLLTLCSTERSGEHTLELVFQRGSEKSSWLGSFSASGFDDRGLWDAATPLPELMLEAQAATNAWGVTIAGGDGEGSVYFAPVRADGLLGSWTLVGNLPEGSEAGLAATDDALYAVNGPYAWYAPLDDAGFPGAWQEMASPGYANVLRVAEGRLWSISRDGAYTAPIEAGGAAGTWSASEPFPEGLDGGLGMAIAGGWMVVVGNVGFSGDWTPRAYGASIGADGSFGSWEQLPGFPGYLGYWLTVDSDGESVYVFPGEDADDLTVYAATVGSGGVGAWQDAGRMGAARDQYATAVVGNRLFLMGGSVDGRSTFDALAGGVSGGELGFDCSF